MVAIRPIKKKFLPLIQKDEAELHARRQWTSLEFLHGEYRLTYGAILSNGDYEARIGTITYRRRRDGGVYRVRTATI